jgi:YnbE-like lipoprotein
MDNVRLARVAKKIAIRDNIKGIASALILLTPIAALGGCVQVAAPDKPIEINLNIRIEQEVVLRIEGAVKDAIAENAEIF